MVAGENRACGYGTRSAFQGGGYLSCWGAAIDPKQREQVGRNVEGSFKMLSIGKEHVCTTMSSFGGRTVHCDGDNSFGQNTDPTPLEKLSNMEGHWTSLPYAVSSGGQHNCLLDEYGVYCWGDNTHGQSTPVSLENPKWIASGGNVSCAIDANDEVRCWGDNQHGQLDVPESLASVTRLSVGSDFVCAVTGGQVVCWGETDDWDINPTTYTNAVHISAGDSHACVLDEIQVNPQQLSASCFGKNDPVDLLNVPQDINSQIRTISAGHGFSCATNIYSGYEWTPEPDGTYLPQDHKGMHCWGKNDEGQSDVPIQLCVGYHDNQVPFEDRTCPEVN